MKYLSIILSLLFTTASAQTTSDLLFHSSKTHFEQSMAASKKLLSTTQPLLNVPEIKKGIVAAYDADATPGDKYMALYFRDLVRSLTEMGHDVSMLNNVEGLPIFLTYYLDESGKMRTKPITYDMLSGAQSNLKGMQTWLTNLSQSVKLRTPDGTLCMADIILKADKQDICKKYLNALHEYLTFVANADKKVTAREKEWLSQLKSMTTPKAQEQKITAVAGESDAFKKLDELIGLASVKEQVRTLANTVKIQKMKEARGMKVQPMSYHCLFLGNPGTGKTSVARIVADIYRELGVIKKGHLIETDRSGLVAEYVGQTAPKVNKLVDSALDGILFIDEAYALTQAGGNDYGKEAVATLLKRMEDDRDRLVVILAGYTKEMSEFLESNSGLKSRFNNYIDFPDYSADELCQIFDFHAKRNDCHTSPDATKAVRAYITDAVKHKDAYFGNARFVRNLLEKALEEQANRLTLVTGNITNDMLQTIERSDIENAIKKMKQ